MSGCHTPSGRISPSRIPRKLSRGLRCILVFMLWVGAVSCQSREVLSPRPDLETGPLIESIPFKDPTVSIPLAVYPLKNFGAPTSAVWVGSTLTEFLISDLSHWSHLTIVSRGSVGSVLREQWIQKLHSDSEELVQVGRLQGARLMVQGGFLESDGHVTVDLQIIDVETGVVWDTVRAQGRLGELHLLEQSLVRLLLERLPEDQTFLDTYHGEGNSDANKPTRRGFSLGKREDSPTRELPNQLVFQEDMSLFGESQLQWRNRAAQAAHKVFSQGFTIELGRPFHGVKSIQEEGEDNVPFLFIPLGVYAEESRLRDVVMPEISHDGDLRIFNMEKSFLKYSGKETVEQRIFVQELARPRRLFVRARSEQNEIIAVFSQWEWRTDRVISITDGLYMKMAFWPTPLMMGVAEFPINWLNRGEVALTFDAAFLEVPQDEVDVAVEWIDPQELVQVPGKRVETEELLTRQLQKWIQDHWAPPLAETLPFKGYLPQNKQRAHLRLHVERGIITHLDHHYSSSDPVFISSLEELGAQLLGACPWCEPNQKLPNVLQSADFRVQCTLMKPTHHLRLGSRLP